MSVGDDHAVSLNFSWIEDGLVAGCRGPRSDMDLAWLADFGIRALVRLAPEEDTGLRASDVERQGIRDCYEPVRDFTPPSQEQLDRIIGFVRASVDAWEPVAVSCGAGQGRTGTVLACYLTTKGLPPQAAIEQLVNVRPGSVEVLRVPGQKDAVFDFYRRRVEESAAAPSPHPTGLLGMESVFRTPERGRGAYLSRLFAFFSEEVVRHWSACDQAPYRDLGRPVVWDPDRSRYHVLDFTLERKGDGARFVTEMKCEIQFEGYRFLTLTGPAEIEHHAAGAAFQKFLRLANEPTSLPVTISGAEQSVAGSILVWGVLTPHGRVAAMEHYGFADVLSVEAMLGDLAQWQPRAWAHWVGTRRRWTDNLFDWLAYPPNPGASQGSGPGS